MPLKAPITQASQVGGGTNLGYNHRYLLLVARISHHRKKPMQPYNWRPAKWVDEQHSKIATVMEPFLTKFRGRCSINGLTLFHASTHIPQESAGYIQSLHALMEHNALFWRAM